MSKFMSQLRRLNREEAGMETMQAVIIFGVAALVLVMLFNLKDKIFEYVDISLNTLGITDQLTKN
jgi:hypothetical protein